MEKQKLPNATAVLVLGILSIIGNCCYFIPGLGFIFGLIALLLSIGDIKKHRLEPELYSNYANLNTGKVLAIVGMIISLIFIGIIMYFIATIGLEAFQSEEAMKEALENAFGIKQ